MDLQLEGRSALVCGGSRGIGRGIAHGLLAEGVRVAILARSADAVEEAVAELEMATGRRPVGLIGDVAGEGVAERSVAQAQEALGGLDILVNNAGGPPMGHFEEHSEDVWDVAYRQCLRSVVDFTKAVAPAMRAGGYGRIVNITSFLAKEPTPPMVLSATFRAGVSAFSKAISSELIADGITINTVGPAAVFTERAESLTRETAERDGIDYEEALARSTASLPIQRFATLDELASLVCYLASPLAAYVSGTTVIVDGALSKSVF